MSVPVINLDHVSVTLGGRTIVDSVSLQASERRLGIIGANGSGKSTLARVIGGLIVPTAGRAVVAGVDPARDGRAARAQIGFLLRRSRCPDRHADCPGGHRVLTASVESGQG